MPKNIDNIARSSYNIQPLNTCRPLTRDTAEVREEVILEVLNFSLKTRKKGNTMDYIYYFILETMVIANLLINRWFESWYNKCLTGSTAWGVMLTFLRN